MPPTTRPEWMYWMNSIRRSRLKELIKGVKTGDVERARGIFETELAQSPKNCLCLRYWSEALKQAINSGQQECCHLVLDNVDKVYHIVTEDTLREEIWFRKIIQDAVEQNMVSLVKRLIGIVDIERYNNHSNDDVCPLLTAAAQSNLEMVQVLLAAGFKASEVFKCYEKIGQIDNFHVQMFFFDMECINNMNDKEKEIMKLILSHVNSEHAHEVVAPWLFDRAAERREFREMLSTIKQLGMDFTPWISLCNGHAQKCMQQALEVYHLPTVKFLIDNGFDVNTPVHECTTALLYFLEITLPTMPVDYESIQIVVELIKGGAHLQGDHGKTAENLCVEPLKGSWIKYLGRAYATVLRIFHRIGAMLSESSQKFIHIDGPLDDQDIRRRLRDHCFNDLAEEIRHVPSLQCLSRQVIRSAAGSRVRELIEQLGKSELPQHLSDFILLKDLDCSAFNDINYDYFESESDGSDEE